MSMRLRSGRRAPCRCCLDWSERKFHLGGTLGAAILDEIVAKGWAVREAKTRIVRFSPGRRAQAAGLVAPARRSGGRATQVALCDRRRPAARANFR